MRAEDDRVGIDGGGGGEAAGTAEQEEQHDGDRAVAALDQPAEEAEADDRRELRRGALVEQRRR